MTKKAWKEITIITAIAVVLMMFCTIYDIMMVDKLLPITNVLWTREECAGSIAAAWGLFVMIWPMTLLSEADEETIEEMTK